MNVSSIAIYGKKVLLVIITLCVMSGCFFFAFFDALYAVLRQRDYLGKQSLVSHTMFVIFNSSGFREDKYPL